MIDILGRPGLAVEAEGQREAVLPVEDPQIGGECRPGAPLGRQDPAGGQVAAQVVRQRSRLHVAADEISFQTAGVVPEIGLDLVAMCTERGRGLGVLDEGVLRLL